MKSEVFAQDCTLKSDASIDAFLRHVRNDLEYLYRKDADLLLRPTMNNLIKSLRQLLRSHLISWAGLTIHDPMMRNLVYLEFRYRIQYSDNEEADTIPLKSHKLPQSLSFPNSAELTAWVVWTQKMDALNADNKTLNLSGGLFERDNEKRQFDCRYVADE